MCDDEADGVSEGLINMAPLFPIEDRPEELTWRGRMVLNVLSSWLYEHPVWSDCPERMG